MSKRIVLLFTILSIFLCGCGKKEEVPEVKEHVPVVENKKFSFIGVGDALIHNGVYIDANTYQKDENGYYVYDFHKMFTYIKDIISDYDLKFYNQETVIGGKNLGLSNYPLFNSPDEIGKDLVDIGFNIVNLASNHVMDKGIKGATYSANMWHDLSDVLVVGSYTSKEQRNTTEIKEINGISYAVLGYTYGTNGISVPSGYEYLANVWPTNNSEFEKYKEQVKTDIESVRDKVDIVMVSMHWGTEYSHSINEYQEKVSEYLSSLGVDVIIGHHPHVIQEIGYVNDTLVIYSLGNFISAQDGIDRRVGLIAAFDVNKEVIDGVTSSVTIDNVKADLLWTHYIGYKKFEVIPFYAVTNQQLSNHENVYNEYIKYINPNNDERIKVGFLGEE